MREGEIMRLTVSLPEFPSFVYVTYIPSEGAAVYHIHPNALDPSRLLAARTRVTMEPRFEAEPHRGVPFEIAPPFGTDMIIAVASSDRLYPAARPQEQERDTWLRELNAALTAARGRGARLAGTAFVLDVAPRQ
jgi:serine/threonine-protein kinase